MNVLKRMKVHLARKEVLKSYDEARKASQYIKHDEGFNELISMFEQKLMADEVAKELV